jgi:hypothetical protein
VPFMMSKFKKGLEFQYLGVVITKDGISARRACSRNKRKEA